MTRAGSGNKSLKCKACKIKHSRQEISNNGGFCSDCITHVKLCNCGCGEETFRYTREGHIAKVKNKSHTGKATQCKACKGTFPFGEVNRYRRFCDGCFSHTKLCECGCEEEIFRYTSDGNIRKYKNLKHGNVGRGKIHQIKWKSDPDYAERYSKAKSEIAFQTHKDKPELGQQHSERLKEHFKDPEERAKLSRVHKKRYEDPKERKKLSKAQKKRYENPEERNKLKLQTLGNKSHTGMKDSENTRRKKRDANLRRYENPEERKKTGEKSKEAWDRDPQRHEDMSERMSTTQFGENNPGWNGGSSFEPYDEGFNEKFKEYIRTRQDNKCADRDKECSKERDALHVHHIDRDKRNSALNNCIALCRSHHMRAHNGKSQLRHKAFVESLTERETRVDF